MGIKKKDPKTNESIEAAQTALGNILPIIKQYEESRKAIAKSILPALIQHAETQKAALLM
jgi:hypothetical protein